MKCLNCGTELTGSEDTSECLSPPEPSWTVEEDGPWFHTPDV